MARCFACFLLTGLCCKIASAIWSPTFISGFRLVMGSWKIMAILLPRISRSSRLPVSLPMRFLPS